MTLKQQNEVSLQNVFNQNEQRYGENENKECSAELHCQAVKILRSTCRGAIIVAATLLCKIHPLISFNHWSTTESESFPLNEFS